jgi:hypothetical protein
MKSSFFAIIATSLTFAGTLQTSDAASPLLAVYGPYNAYTRINGGDGFPMDAIDWDSDVVSSAVHSSYGMTPDNDERSWWKNIVNEATSVDPATAPYLSFTLTLSLEAGYGMAFDRFVFQGLGLDGNPQTELRWSVDGYSSALGSFTVDPDGEYTMTSVDLSDEQVILGGTVEFRVYYYGTSRGESFVSETNKKYPTFDDTPAEYRYNGAIVTITGEAVAVPEPSAIMLVGVCGLMAGLRRKRSAR